MLARRVLRWAFASCVLATLAAADVLTVGPAGSGARYLEIQAAINAADDDDVILVAPGLYQRITVTKPLRILGLGPGSVEITGGTDQPAVRVHSIGAAKELVLSHVKATTMPFNQTPAAIELANSAGTLVLHDVDAVVDDTFRDSTEQVPSIPALVGVTGFLQAVQKDAGSFSISNPLLLPING